MKRHLAIVAILVGAACCHGQAPKAEDDGAVHAKVNLTDGSQLQGTLRNPALALVTSFGKTEIPLAQIASLEFTKDGATVKFRNRDVLTGTLEGTTFELRTIFNDVRLDRANVKSIQFLGGGKNTPRGTEPGLLLHALLDSDSENLGMFNAYMEATNVRIIEGPAGNNAMLLETEDAKVNIDLPFSPYLMPEGTIECWAKLPQPDQRLVSGIGGQPWFFIIECPGAKYNYNFCLGFTVNDGAGKGGLVGRIYGFSPIGTHSYGTVSTVAGTGILGDTPGGWHHYALVWKRDGLDLPEGGKKTIFLTVDGNMLASAIPVYEEGFRDIQESDNNKTRLLIHDRHTDRTCPLAVSNLKIWDYAKTPEELRRHE